MERFSINIDSQAVCLDEAVMSAHEVSETEISCIHLVENKKIVLKSFFGISEDKCPTMLPLAKEVSKMGIPLYIEDISAHLRFPAIQKIQEINFYFGLPLFDHTNHVIGVISVSDKSKKILTETTKRTLSILAESISSKLSLSIVRKENDLISKFPSTNPNPLLSFTNKFKLLYSNNASSINFLSDFKIINGILTDEDLKVSLSKLLEGFSVENIVKTRKDRIYAISAFYDDISEVIYVYASDITQYIDELVQKEKRLTSLKNENESQKKFYEYILNNLPAEVAIFDKSHRYLFVNSEAVKSKEAREFLIGKDDFDYAKWKGISDKKAKKRRSVFDSILETKKFKRWTDRFVDSNGNQKIVQRRMGPLFDETGEVRFVIGYGQDETLRFIAEEENLKLSLVAKNTHNGVCFLDKERKITWTNDAFVKRSGFSFPELKGKLFTHCSFQKTKTSSLKKLTEAMNNRVKTSVELLQLSKDGRRYWVDVHVQPLFNIEEEFIGHMFVEFDITINKNAEKQLNELNSRLEDRVKERTKKLIENEKKLKESLLKEKELGELKTSFVSTASHQFRTPLTAIQANIEMLEVFILKSDNNSNSQISSKIIKRIQAAICNMTGLMDEVLTLGKITSGNVVFNPEHVDLMEFCQNLVLEFNMIQKDGRVINLMTTGEPQNVKIDAHLLNHALSNLISNAFKYSVGKQNPELHIDYLPKEVKISVKDFGCGIAENDRSKLFQPFFRSDEVIDIEGTGLGLSIAKEYLEINSCTIDVMSKLGEGSCFEITFPSNLIRSIG